MLDYNDDHDVEKEDNRNASRSRAHLHTLSNQGANSRRMSLGVSFDKMISPGVLGPGLTQQVSQGAWHPCGSWARSDSSG